MISEYLQDGQCSQAGGFLSLSIPLPYIEAFLDSYRVGDEVDMTVKLALQVDEVMGDCKCVKKIAFLLLVPYLGALLESMEILLVSINFLTLQGLDFSMGWCTGSWKRVTINREGQFTCPARTVATFAVYVPFSPLEAGHLAIDDARTFKVSFKFQSPFRLKCLTG